LLIRANPLFPCKSFNSIKDYQRVRKGAGRKARKLLSIPSRIIHLVTQYFTLPYLSPTFNSIKDYLNVLANHVSSSVNLSIPSRIISFSSVYYMLVRANILSIPSRIIFILPLILEPSWKIMTFNSIKDYPVLAFLEGCV